MRGSLLILLALAGCGGASSPPPAEPTPAGRCVTQPAMAEQRRARPETPSCNDPEAWRALADACNQDSPEACYQISICVSLQEQGADMADDEREQHVSSSLAGLRRACDAGIAEACTLRVGLQLLGGQPLPADGCDDLVRACNLGDGDGCLACQQASCD